MDGQEEEDYDYGLKFLLVGDPDVGKEEILAALEDASPQSPYATCGMEQKTTLLMVDGRRIKLRLWSTSGSYLNLISIKLWLCVDTLKLLVAKEVGLRLTNSED